MLYFYNKRNVRYLGLATLAVGAVFGPDLSSFSSFSPRALSTDSAEDQHSPQSRSLQQLSKPAPPPGFDLQCGPGQEAFTLDWADVELDFTQTADGQTENTVTFSTGTTVTIKTSVTGGAKLHQWSMWQNADKTISTPVFGTLQKGEYCGLDPAYDPPYPEAVS